MDGAVLCRTMWDPSLPVFKAFLYQICADGTELATGGGEIYRVLGFGGLVYALRGVCVRHVVGRAVGLALKAALVIDIIIFGLAGLDLEYNKRQRSRSQYNVKRPCVVRFMGM